MKSGGFTFKTAGALCTAAGLALVASTASAQSTSSIADTNRGLSNSANAVASSLSNINESGIVGPPAPAVGVDGGCVGDPEGEPCVVPVAPADAFNGGCNSDAINPLLTPLAVGQVICGQTASDGALRDTDWFELTVVTAGDYAITLDSAGTAAYGAIGDGAGPIVNPTCAVITQINPVETTPDGPGFVVATLQAGIYWIFVGELDTATPSDCFDYTLQVVPLGDILGACCLAGGACEDGLTEADCDVLFGQFQGMGTDCGSVVCDVVVAPDNDECTSAQALDLGVAFQGTTLGAGPDFGLPACGAPLTGPAVWFTYTATTAQTVTIETCGTANLDPATAMTDTTLNVFSNTISAFCLGTFCCVAGNDDSCDLLSSVTFCADPAAVDGGVYFVVLAGFDGETGDYEIVANGDGVSCTLDLEACVQCDAGDVLEGEPCPTGTDEFNGGCNSSSPVFSSLTLDQTVCGTADAGGGTRDTDWYILNITEAGTYTLTFEAAFEGVAGFIGDAAGVLVNPDCAQVTAIAELTTPAPCEAGTVTIDLQVGEYWIFAGPLDFEGVTCPDAGECPGNGRYRLSVSAGTPVVEPCPGVECPAGGIAEAEACGDSSNEGCNTVGEVYSGVCSLPGPDGPGVPGCSGDPACEAIVCALDAFCCDTEWDQICADLAVDNCGEQAVPGFEVIACGDIICGNITATNGTRDTDWFQFEVTNPAGATVTASLTAQFDGVVFFIDATDCGAPVVIGDAAFSNCDSGSASTGSVTETLAPGTYVVFVSSGDENGGIFEGVFCGQNSAYVLELSGDCGGVVCPCVGDLNGDCIVDALDLGILLGAFGSTDEGDLNGDTVTDALDLGILLGDFNCTG